MKHSIKMRLIIVLLTLLSATIFFSWMINRVFLGKYYENYKIKRLGDTYFQVNSKYDPEKLPELSLTFEQLASKQNVSLYIFDGFSYSEGIFLITKFPTSINEVQNKRLQSEIVDYYNKTKASENTDKNEKTATKLLVNTDKYSIYRHFDTRLEVNYIELYGVLDSGDRIFIRSNYDNITESAGISNTFFAYVGMASIFIGSWIMYFIGVEFTKPILRLSEMTKAISNLNFDVCYNGNRQDEVGELGHSINVLSEKLENTISSLKSANNELQNDIKKKEKSEEMRKEFLSNVTHELKTPIALIQGYAEGLKDNIQGDEESREFYCEVIIDEAAKMNSMVKRLLSLNELEFGDSKPQFDRFDLMVVLNSVVNAMNMVYRQKGAESEINGDASCFVWADEYLVEEVITNYISNALNHVEEDKNGRKVVSICVRKCESKVRISVFNTGKPIPEEDVERIWDKFYKVDKARTREYGGNGIGLSIVKAIMNSLNRECGVKNWDNGVEFWFELDTKA